MSTGICMWAQPRERCTVPTLLNATFGPGRADDVAREPDGSLRNESSLASGLEEQRGSRSTTPSRRTCWSRAREVIFTARRRAK